MEPPGQGASELIDHREGFLVGGVVGAALAARTATCRSPEAVRATIVDGNPDVLAPPSGRRRAGTALPDALLVEFMSGGVDLRRLAGRWIDWQRTDGFETDPMLSLALKHLDEFDAPIPVLPCGSVAAMNAALPAALASGSPRAMVAGAFHVARMLDPEPGTALCAVGLVIAAEALLAGRRDVIPDVIAALRANDAPPQLLDPVRAIPRDSRAAPPIPVGDNPDPIAASVWLLWMVHHRPRAVAALCEMATTGGIAPTIGSIAGALFGARDGVGDWPGRWLAGSGEEVDLRRALAARLGSATGGG